LFYSDDSEEVAIGAGSGGGFVFLVGVVFLLWFLRRRRKNRIAAAKMKELSQTKTWRPKPVNPASIAPSRNTVLKPIQLVKPAPPRPVTLGSPRARNAFSAWTDKQRREEQQKTDRKKEKASQVALHKTLTERVPHVEVELNTPVPFALNNDDIAERDKHAAS
jgi:hypothetical protein